MPPAIEPSSRPVPPHGRPRRGSAYVLVLALSTLLSVIGLGILTTTQITTRTVSQANDADEAAVLAEAAVEWGLACVNTDSNWRTTYTHNVETAQKAMGRGTISFKLTDDTGQSNLNAGTTGGARLYGFGRVGKAVRIYSVDLIPYGPALPVLQTAAHAAGAVTTTGAVGAAGGPLSSNGLFTVLLGSTITGNVEATSYLITGTVTGTTSTVAAKQMPSSTVFDTYNAMATDIPFSSIHGGNGDMDKQLLSPTNNPWGATNAKGVYHIHVPATGTLHVQHDRIVACLLVELDPGAGFQMDHENLWDPPSSSYPSLILKTGLLSTVSFGSSSSALSESSNINYNPPGTPYPYSTSGTTDSDTTDTYPNEFHGILHVIGSTVTPSFGTNFTNVGVVIVEGPASIGANTTFTNDSTFYANPPQGYTQTGSMIPVSATWKWEKAN